MSFWKRLFGGEVDIDFSVPLQAVPLKKMRRVHNAWAGDLKVTRNDTGEVTIVTAGCYLDIPNDVDFSIESLPAPAAQPGARNNAKAHGKAASKSKRRRQKKPSRKRTRK